jgi:acyl carrier protein
MSKKSDWKYMSIRKSVKSFILRNYLFTDDDSALSDTESLVHAGIVDSTGILELIIHVEEAWGIQVLPEEMVPDNFDSVDRVVDFIARKQQVLV